jgi:hypothetical protein
MAIFIRDQGCGCPNCNNNPCVAPAAPLPTIKCDSISSTATKCGFEEYVDVSTPPKIYIQKTFSGSSYVQNWNGDPAGCYGDCFEQSEYEYSGATRGGYDCIVTESGNLKETVTSPCGINVTSITNTPCTAIDQPPFSGNYNQVLTNITNTYTGIGCQTGTGFYTGGSVAETLSDEYTTDALITYTVSNLPSYPDTFTGTCSSLRYLSSNELTYAIRRFKYKFLLPDLTGYTCYKITWLEGSTAKSYIWDGVATQTPVYGPILEPSSNGTIAISSIAAACSCV